MRRRYLVSLVATAVFVTITLRSVSTLLRLLVEDTGADVIHPSELPAISTALHSSLPQLIPKAIHQTYLNSAVPERWLLAQESCIALHPDSENKFWTDEDSVAFIGKEHPWVLDPFRNYARNIRRG
jgi:mannosyltransferase OCH1-like enzyme